MHIQSPGENLTFAGLNAVEPCVSKVWVADISTLLEPTCTSETTTGPSSVVNGTLRTRDRVLGSVRHSRSRDCSSID